MTSPHDDHSRWSELVSGYALSALEPEDEADLLQHLTSCARCTRELVAARDVLAQLAYAAPLVEPPPGLFDRIRAEVEASSPGAFDEPVPVAPPAAPLSLDEARDRRATRRGPATRWLSVAAGVALAAVVALGAWNVSLQRDRDRQGDISAALQSAVSTLESAPGQTVPLASAKTGRVGALAVVHSDRISLVVDGMRPNDASSTTYVLWGQDGTGAPYGVAAFDVDTDGIDVIRDLALPLAGTGPKVPERLMVTQEQGRAIPASPLTPVLMAGRPA
ncbi:MAG: uncharacterized protein JWL64_2296 [Frankiales bacterium]|nr:uncharacterized protein [Frankiales bacterium]